MVSLANVACGSDTTRVVYVAGDAEPTSGTSDASSDARPADLSPKGECERYLACVNEETPAQGGAAVALYGDDSPCWKGSSADAKSCGDACHLARTAIAPSGSGSSQCGCTEDAECKGFCSNKKVCAGSDWVGILDECAAYATDAKSAVSAWKKANVFGNTCVLAVDANCDAIRDLAFRDTGAQDSKNVWITAQSLHDYYACPRTASGWGNSGSVPSGTAPSSCAGVAVVGLKTCKTSTSTNSTDLMLLVE
ncbi:hypothetical protein AKJ09_00819 [Labilithrix luteola]|uniref:Uncharacterized protein n=1 Tax=Labilithrix luteola TaxID=1391654 RepID=A0A0K1PKV0_9BACT|nr:hypothetical protein AKJ09_00819 [Labilithrix luteola]